MQEITVQVWDPTDKGTQAIGKQKINPEGIFYTPVSGIWQTVWLEPVPHQSIENIKITPNIDNETVSVIVQGNVPDATKDCITVKVFEGEKEITKRNGTFGTSIELSISKPKLWSPDHPHLESKPFSDDSVGSHALARFDRASQSQTISYRAADLVTGALCDSRYVGRLSRAARPYGLARSGR